MKGFCQAATISTVALMPLSVIASHMVFNSDNKLAGIFSGCENVCLFTVI